MPFLFLQDAQRRLSRNSNTAASFCLLPSKLISRLHGKGRKVLDRTRVSGEYAQHFAALHRRQRLLGAQDGQRAGQADGVNFGVNGDVFGHDYLNC